MKKLLAFLSLILGAECFSLEQAPTIFIDNTPCQSVWDILQNKNPNRTEKKVFYNRKSLESIDQKYRDILMDYAAFFVKNADRKKAEENDMLLERLIYVFGWDLRKLSESSSKYKEKISTSLLACKLTAASRIAGGSSGTFEQEIKRDIDQLKDIIAIVEEDAFGIEEGETEEE